MHLFMFLVIFSVAALNHALINHFTKRNVKTYVVPTAKN